MTRFTESEMTFEFEDDCLYRIELSQLLTKVNSCADCTSSYSTCECVVKQGDKVLLIEAKTSFADPASDEGKTFCKRIEEIVSKFRDTMSVFHAARLRHPQEQKFGGELWNTKLEKATYELILIIRNHDKEWLQPVSDSLKSRLKPFLRLWRIADTNIKVYNEQLARKNNIIK